MGNVQIRAEDAQPHAVEGKPPVAHVGGRYGKEDTGNAAVSDAQPDRPTLWQGSRCR